MKKAIFCTMALGLLVACLQDANAGQILQNQWDGINQILYYSPIGQTFTAEDAHILSIGFWVKDMNPGAGPIDLRVELFEGIGTGGLSFGSSPITGLTPRFEGFFDADFRSVSLTVGNIYTAIISSTTERGGVGSYQWALPNGTPLAPDLYTGGDAIYTGNIIPNFDLTFRIIPEPATIALLALGGLLLRKLR